MAEIRHESKGKEIRNLLLVIGSGIIGAVAVALMMLYYYNPSGSYLAGNVLLSPESTKVIKFQDTHPTTGSPAKFIFDQIEFSYYDSQLKQWKKLNVEMDQYAKFYQLIGNERSLEVPDEIKRLFNQPSPSVLSLKIRTEATSQSISKPFIEVNFVNEGDYYRIELHEEGSSGSWAYFYHPGIYNKVLEMFIQP